MQREVTLEEYFLLKPSDRPEFFDKLTQDFNAWEPSMRSNIEHVLELGRKKYHKEGEQAASDLLATIQSHEILSAIRRHFGEDGESEPRDANIRMLLSSLVVNHNFDYTTRFETVAHYVGNPRYDHTDGTNAALVDALDMLQMELFDKTSELSEVLHKLSTVGGETEIVVTKMAWFKPRPK